MKMDVKIPEVGESVREAVLAQWYKKEGELVRKEDVLFLIETDKVTLEVSAQADGVLHILVGEGETVTVGTLVATLDTDAEVTEKREEPTRAPERETVREMPRREETTITPPEERSARTEREAAAAGARMAGPDLLSPSVRRMIAEKGLDVSQIRGTGPGGRISKGDVITYMEKEAGREKPRPAPVSPSPATEPVREAPAGSAPEESVTRKPMSPIRQRIAERLLQARQSTAMLTTFNEVDMSLLQEFRRLYKDAFRDRYGVSLGMMSFFIKASVTALKEYPEVNAFIEGKDIVHHHYYHIGVAVGAERGLVVPVIRHADRLGFAEVERAIVDYVKKIRENRLEIADLEGGTFTISNGGVYGSLLSTPILNAPQSGILGMHKIEDRPVVVDGQVVARPMMYVAFSYDHRIIDGREAVGFLKRIKECVENPERIMLEI